jgi:hypothetical protein
MYGYYLKTFKSMYIKSIYSLKEGARSAGACHIRERRRGRALVAGMVPGIAIVLQYLVLTCAGRRAFGSCICIFNYAESRGQGRGLGHVPEPFLWGNCPGRSGWRSGKYSENLLIIHQLCCFW